MNSDFAELLSLLNRYGVRYLVVGGYAVLFHATPRFTKDIDIAISAAPSDIHALSLALSEFGFPLEEEALRELSKPNRMISLGRPPSRVDLLNEIPGVDFEDAYKRRAVFEFGGNEISVLGLDDLIIAKRTTARPQDLADLKLLESKKRRNDRR